MTRLTRKGIPLFWTDAKKADLARMKADGKTNDEIRTALRAHSTGAVQSAASIFGCAGPHGGVRRGAGRKPETSA